MIYGIFVVSVFHDMNPLDICIIKSILTAFTNRDDALNFFNTRKEDWYSSIVVYEMPEGSLEGWTTKNWKLIARGDRVPEGFEE